MMHKLRPYTGLFVALLIGVGFKVVLWLTGSVTFDSDEAILALMARHITQGDLVTFFYGQYYMGALDAYLIAGMFTLIGESVLAVRVTQMVLYAGVLITTYFVAHRLTESHPASTAAALLIAVPTVLFSTYTTATLGNYVEILVLNNIIFLLVWDILQGKRDAPGWWFLVGVLAGIGWWGMALIVVSVFPLLVLGVWERRHDLPWGKGAVLVAGFVVGALPWVIALITNTQAVIADTTGGRVGAVYDSSGIIAIGERVLFLAVFNLPALFGLRPPWSVEWILLPVGVLVAGVYIMAVYTQAKRADLPRLSMLGGIALMVVLYIATSFGFDLTGRYLLPLYPILAVLVAAWLLDLHRSSGRWWVPAAVMAVMLGYNLWGNIRSMQQNPPGLTTQFNLYTHLPEQYDDDLIAFLEEIGVRRGYTNYWVAYRFAFLTQEDVILVPLLPDHPDLRYTPLYNRYAPYNDAVEEVENVAYITSNSPLLDETLRDAFEERDITYQEEQIGPYTVFYDLPGNVSPVELDPPWELNGE